jgi:hypothetical protein
MRVPVADQISNRYKCIFVHVPKAAGSSIENSSIFNDQRDKTGEYVGGHISAMQFQKKYPEEFKAYFKFSFVRNPYSRIVSAFFYLMAGGSGNLHDTEIFKRYFRNSDGNFTSFCENELSTEMMENVIHFRPQYQLLCDEKQTVMVDFVGQQESFSQDAKKIFRALGVPYKHQHLLRSKNKHFSAYYTKDAQEKVFSLYRLDFETFGYQSKIDSQTQTHSGIHDKFADLSSFWSNPPCPLLVREQTRSYLRDSKVKATNAICRWGSSMTEIRKNSKQRKRYF